MSEFGDLEFELANEIVNGRGNSGFIITTKNGKQGRTYHKDELVGGKVRVYLENGLKMLCLPGTLTVNGFID